MTVINHPIGTHHTMSRKWLNENGVVECKKDAPEDVYNEWKFFQTVDTVHPKIWDIFWELNAKYMCYVTQYGSYDYQTTLKIFDE